ncbi:MAG: lipopolysaccharide biosynthesis protein [Paludibacteraceae bacterium]|nr:lipopolysaccharide biosynthesis protein [Paludibacteraceae bacterium]
MEDKGLKSSAVSGAIWTAVEKMVCQVVQFTIGIILSRLLSPSDYGVVAMLAIFIAIAQTFADSGLSNALIQKKDRTDVDYSTIFIFNAIVSVSFYAILYVASPYIAKFYGMPILEDVTRVVALSIIISGFTTVQSTRLRINLQFRKLSIVTMVSMLFSGVVGLVCAFNGLGVWSLVIQTLSGQICTSLGVWFLSKWKPRLLFSYASFRKLWKVGSNLLASSLINTIYGNLYTLVVGKFFSGADAGYYNRGNHYALLPVQTVQDMAIKINYPILAKIQDDDERLINAYKKLMTVPLYLLYPILVGLSVVAPYLIPVMIGEKWMPCVPILQVLSLAYMLSPLTHLNLNLLYVKGRTDLVLKLECIKKPIAFLILFASIPFGLIWMVVGKALYEFVAFSFNCYYTGKMYGYGELKQLKSLLPILCNCAVMAVVIYVSMLFFSSPVLKLCVAIPMGVISYILYSIITKDENFNEVLRIVKGKMGK